MKKLKKIGKVLNRTEMRSVAGGFPQCVEGYVCGPPCPSPDGPGGQLYGYACENGPGSACKTYLCYYN